MTRKEQAHELVDKFYDINSDKEQKIGTSPYISRSYTKQCALILVKDKIDYIKTLPVSDMMQHDLVAEQLLIQQEIEKI